MDATTTIDQPRTQPVTKPVALIEDYRRRLDEMGRIILAYSDATERLQQDQAQLHTHVAQLQEELGEKNKQLERRNRLAALGEMAAGIAHEIRNPLGAIKLYTSLLKTDVADRPLAGQTLGKVTVAIGRIELIVSQTLNFTRDVRASVMDGDVAEVIRDAIEIARARRPECAVEFIVDGPATLTAPIDANLLTQALSNLLNNASDACGEQGTVTARFSKTKKNKIRIVVEDTGPGLPPEVIEKLFNPFFTTKDHGTGLGLAIVHRIVEAHEGTIAARNGKSGAIFELTI